LFVLFLGGIGDIAVLDQLVARDERDELAGHVDNRELAELVALEDLVGFGELGAFSCREELRGYHVGQRRLAALDKFYVAVRNHTEELGPNLAVLRDRDTGKAVLDLDWSTFSTVWATCTSG
jgi:hypothetical protein